MRKKEKKHIKLLTEDKQIKENLKRKKSREMTGPALASKTICDIAIITPQAALGGK